jgi:uncharacterized protein YfaS (alpha-2-macroglobulin family)
MDLVFINFLKINKGDEVTSTINVKRAEGSFPEGAKIKFQVRVDSKEVANGESKIDSEGNAMVTFELPKEMENGEGTINFIIDDNGNIETKSKTIPILLENMEVNIYPEGKIYK